MGILSVLAAAAAGYIFGAIWYMSLSKPWIEASGVACDADGKPLNKSVVPFVLSAVAMLLVAGMMRHVLAMTGTEGIGKSLTVGLGVGLFFIAPWIMINNAYSDRPFKLTLIDSGYAVIGCALIGAVLALF